MDQGRSASVSAVQMAAVASTSSQSEEQNQSLRTRLNLASIQQSLQEPMVLSPAKDISPFTFSFEGLSPITFNPQIKSTSSVSSDVGSTPVSSQQQETASVVPITLEQQQQQQGGRVSKPRRRSHRRQRRRRRVTSTNT